MMTAMDKVHISELIRKPLPSHGIFVGLWVLLLILGGVLQGGIEWPWGLVSGLVPILAGFLFFRFWPQHKDHIRWLVLIASESLGVILGSTLVAGPDSPLMLLALWPVAWAAIRLTWRAGLAVVASMEIVYLALGVWQAGQKQNPSEAILGLVLYVGALYAIFALLRERERVLVAAAQPAPPAIPAARPVAAEPERDETLHQDLAVARDIQVSLLLASSPKLPGWESSTSFLPARELGGDLYDFVEITPPTWGIMIGDVSGKGIPAALHMAVARTLFRMEARNGHEPAQTLGLLNRYVIEQAPQGCITLLYAHLNTLDGSLRLANAGHNYPLLLNNSVRELALDGLPLGIDADYTFAEATAQLDPGDVLIFYTDGVIEAFNGAGELFGFERLRQLLHETALRRPRSLTRQIVRAVRAFTGNTPQSDDITLVVLRRRYQDRVQEMAEVALDVLGPEGRTMLQEYFAGLNLPPETSPETWRAAILTLGGAVRDRWGQGLSRELMQQLFLTLEGL
jgi:sigma-B regulation protein RsbU (phosphoserine phosphatase)